MLRGRRAYGIHIGDSRLYRLSGGQLTQMTTDHHLNPKVLSRAIGLAGGSRADFCDEPAAPGDRFLLTSDGIHGPLSAARIAQILRLREAPDETAQSLVTAALQAGGRDNATALIVDVLEIPAANRADLAAGIAVLPIGPLPEPGEAVDQYQLDTILSDGPMSRLFRATDRTTGKTVVLKFPDPDLTRAPLVRAAFLREAWITTRLRGPWLGQAPEPDPGRQTRLYSVMAFHPGETLEQRLGRKPRIGLEEGLGHRRDARQGHGLAAPVGDHPSRHQAEQRHAAAGWRRAADRFRAGAGARRRGGRADRPRRRAGGRRATWHRNSSPASIAAMPRTDVFALGVTLYRMFSGGAFPYGETKSFAPPRQTTPTPLTRHRPDLPAWLDGTILRAAALAREDRFADAIDLVLALESAESFRPVRGETLVP